MLVRFSTSNYLSFDEEIELSMVPGLARKHTEHIVKDPTRRGINLLRLALVFGANASGKSNLVKAMDFAQDLIIGGTDAKQSIPVKCHMLNKACAKQPSKFQFELKYNNNYYLYGFELDTDIIQAEWLFKTDLKTHKPIFERKTSKKGNVSVKFGKLNLTKKKDNDFLDFVARGTRPNQLFLTESIQRNVDQFQEVYLWFKNVLNIVFPESKFVGHDLYSTSDDVIISTTSEYLRQFDSGVSDITFQKVDLNIDQLDFPDHVKEGILSGLKPGHSALVHTPDEQRFVFRMSKDKNITILRIMTRHKIKGSDDPILFDLGYESDGTQRMLDLIPTFITMSESGSVFVFDELDRSLHPNLSKRILQQFLVLNPSNNSQLIATTHESSLLDLNILRRDEIWFTEKNDRGSTNLYSLEEFAPRYDKDIRKGYLLGRFGSIPVLGKIKSLNINR